MRPVTGPARLLMTTDAVGGVWRYALDTGAALTARGIEVTLAGLGPPPSAAQRDESASASADLVWLNAGLDWTAAAPGDLRRAGNEIDRLLRARRVDAVQLNSPALVPFIDPAVPKVAAAHSCLATWWRAVKGGPLPADWRWHRDVTARGLAAADMVLAPSAAFATALREVYGPLPRLQVVRNSAEPVPAEPKSPFVLSAGRWWDEAKNLHMLETVAGGLPWPVRVAGPLRSPDGATITPRAVDWIGDLPYPALRDRMARAAIFTSLSLYEPFGLAVLEAASAEAALVLADIPTFRELWGSCALFVDPRDPTDVAGTIGRLIASDGLRADLGAAAAERARAYSPDRQADALFSVYAGLHVRTAVV